MTPKMFRLHASLGLVLSLGACSIDERTLEPRPLTSIPGSGGSAQGGGTGSMPEGGAAGADAPDGEGLVQGCADLDTDGVPDCEATLVQNPTFTSDVDGWTPLGETELTWQPENALGDLPSGSAELTASEAHGSAYQCVPLTGAYLVIAYASAYVEPGDDPQHPAQAALEVTFFQGADCSGVSDGYFETPASTLTDAWTTVQAGGPSKDTTLSASIALVGLQREASADYSIYFDNVMLKAQSL
jgi:hypothetical protein